MDWKPLDLHLLVILNAVARERNAARAASRLKISRSAVRNAVERLRQLLNDPLLIETPNGCEPTPYCLQLIEPTRMALEKLSSTLDHISIFDPASPRKLRVAVDDHSALIFGTRLALIIAEKFPEVELQIIPAHELDVPASLDQGDIELSIGTLPAPNEHFDDQLLIYNDPVIIVRRGHPATFNGTMNIDSFLRYYHININSDRQISNLIDDGLTRLGLSRRVTMHLPIFSAFKVLERSNMIAVTDRITAQSIGDYTILDILALPFPTPKLPIFMLWSCGSHSMSDHRWLRNTIIEILKSIPS